MRINSLFDFAQQYTGATSLCHSLVRSQAFAAIAFHTITGFVLTFSS